MGFSGICIALCYMLYCFKFLNVLTVNKCLPKKFIKQKKKKNNYFLVKGIRLPCETFFFSFPFSSHCFLIAMPFFTLEVYFT